MRKRKIDRLFFLWVIVLVVELLSFNVLIHQVHGTEEILFYIVLIGVTLVVGSVGLFIFNKREN